MNVKKQQMQLQLQQQTLQRRHNRTGFESLLEQPAQVSGEMSPQGVVSIGTGYRWQTQHHNHHYDRQGTAGSMGSGNTPPPPPPKRSSASTEGVPVFDGGVPKAGDGSPPAATTTAGRLTEPVTTPPPTSPLSLPSPYYDRNPVIGFPFHHQHQQQQHHHHHHNHGPESSVTASVPLANVQNVVYSSDQDHNDHYATNTKYYYQRHHNYKSGGLTDGRDDDKENIKQQDAECLQQQLDEVLRACVDYEERHKSRQQQPGPVPGEDSSGKTSPSSTATTTTITPPHQNRIKTNGSLPRDAKKPGTETSSPTSPLSPSSVTWPTTSCPSSPTLSPLSLNTAGDGDSVFLEKDNIPSPVSPPPQNATTCGSPRTRIKTLVPSTAAAAAAYLYYGSKQDLLIRQRQQQQQQHNGDGNSVVDKIPLSNLQLRSKSPPGLSLQMSPVPASLSLSHQPASQSPSPQLTSRSPQSQLTSRSPPPQRTSRSSPHQLTSLSPQPQLTSRSPQPQLTSRSPPPTSWQTTTSWLRSSPFATNPTDGGSASTPATVSAAERSAEAAERRRILLVELSEHKSRLVELHLRREEVDRELIIETALLQAELDAADDETRQSDNIIDGLDRAVAECRKQMDTCTVKQQEQRVAADSQLAEHRRELNGLRSRLESIEDDDVQKTEIRAAIDKQMELLEAEQKLYEDVEFGLLEEEAGWLARREELHRDRAAAVAVRRARRARAEWLRAQLDQLRSVGDDQLRALRADVNAATLSIQQGHKKLHDLDAAIDSANISAYSPSQDHHNHLQYRRGNQFPYDNSSSDQPQSQPKSLDWSWDPQTLKSPMSPLSSSSSSWDQQSKSVGSPWSPTSANPMGYSLPTNGDATVNNSNGLMTGSMTTTCCSSIASSGGEDDGCRPGSDGSTSRMSMSTIFDGGAGVKFRQKNKSSPPDITKRPLTRYLPVRYDGDNATENQISFDLRAHIESAGHQLDDNEGNREKHFWIDSTSCRGYLKKLSGTGAKNSRRSGRKWLKRWFVFNRRSRTLSYYHRRSDEDVSAADQTGGSVDKKTRPRASIRFQDIQEVYVDHTNSSKGQGCAFVVKTAQRTFYLSAATGQAVRVWVDVIFTGAEGYREYLKTTTDDRVLNGDRPVQRTKS